jgi:EAL domain-containing protein (putative c-di-GMP-specific phosphodiesterase class I)
VHYLKIDGSYTRDIHRDRDNQFFVRAVCDTAHSIDILVIAGAVETADEAGMIARLYVDGVQGNLYGKPLPV